MKYTEFRRKLPRPLFTRQDMRLRDLRVFDYQLSLWQKQNYIVKLKNGFYIFKEALGEISPEELSDKLYAPSYVSLEKALFIYGFIPEVVYAVTSITPKTTRRFNTKLGHFLYRHMKPSLFFGYKQVQGKTLPYLMAEPEKALLDFLYFNLPKIKTKEELAELRLNVESLRIGASLKKLTKYLKYFNNKRLERTIDWLLED